MRVSRSSWHYKVYRYLRNFYEDGPILPFRGKRTDYVPKSLCSYFWGTILFLTLLPVVVSGLTLFALGVVVSSPVWYPIRQRRKNREARGEIKIGDTLIVARAKSFKHKHCPLVELV